MVKNDDLKVKCDDLSSGKVTCEENVKYFLSNIQKNNKNLNIVLQINENAEQIAKNLDQKRENKEELGSLFGLCFLFKSNISIVDMNISCASKTLENYRGTFNADVVEKIVKEDGIILGIVNNDEFASGSSGENSAFGLSTNPTIPSRVPGGSSSGSASSVAGDFCDIALGSDTGGSIRNPASHCGIIGVKPSYGRVSRYGLVDLSMSLDQIGVLSKDTYGSKLVMKVISGHSDNDPTTGEREVQDYLNLNMKEKYRIGIIKTFNKIETDQRIKDLLKEKVEKLKEQGHDIIEVEVDNIDLAIQAYYPIVYTEFYSGTRKFDGIKYGEKIEDTVGEEALRRIFGGKEISRSEFEGAYYKKALRVKEVVAEELKRVFTEVDFILSPVTPILPHKPGTKLTVEEMYGYDAFTIPANLSGICGGVVTKDTIEDNSEAVPCGIQVLADRFREDLMFEGMDLLDKI